MAINSLGRELACLKVPERENLVNAALRLTHCGLKADVIMGLVASLEHLDPSQRDNLVTTAINLPSDRYRARAIRAMGPKLALLEETQCENLAQAAADLTMSDYAEAVVGLFKGLADLDPARRNIIINPAVESFDRANGLWLDGIALLPGVDYFSESQRERIIASTRASLHLSVDSYFGIMIPLVAPALDYLGKPYCDAMFNRCHQSPATARESQCPPWARHVHRAPGRGAARGSLACRPVHAV